MLLLRWSITASVVVHADGVRGEASLGAEMFCVAGDRAQAFARRKEPRRTFLENHVKSTVSVDFFILPTIRVQILHVFFGLAHDRRRIIHFHVTAHPSVE